MLRRLLTVLSLVSLVLGIAASALWVRSYWRSDYLGRTDAAGWVGVLSMVGQLRIERGSFAMSEPGWKYESSQTPDRRPSPLAAEIDARDRVGGPLLKGAGFAYASVDYAPQRHRQALYLPHWALVCLLLMLPAAWTFRALRRRRRFGKGHCPACGYDLRATPDRCPECGWTPCAVNSLSTNRLRPD